MPEIRETRVKSSRLFSEWIGLSTALALTFLVVASPPSLSAATALPASDAVDRHVNAPFFVGEVRVPETAIFWFGRVDRSDNYADVRIGYNEQEIFVHVSAFDRRLWYDPTPSAARLTAWDAVTLYLDLDGKIGDVPDANAFSFVGQLNWWEPRADYQNAYRGDGSSWVAATIPFTTTAGWRGAGFNDNVDDRGWALSYHIPFDSLGLSVSPPQGTVWGMALRLHDRDDVDGTPIIDKLWPEALEPRRPTTWGQLVFGMPTYHPSPAVPVETLLVRQGLDGTLVSDADVGGGATCGAGLDFWSEWGSANYAGQGDLNVQNQSDVADWPCFSKYYVTFPLDALPPGKAIISATLTLHQFGNAGGGAWGVPEPSLIQVLTVAEDWDEATLTWNNAPLARENISAAWVDPLSSFPGWPGVPREWDVSHAVPQAYAAGEPVRLVLYEADSAYHSGKYFVSSDADDWNAEGRPTLEIQWGEPTAAVRKQVMPVTASYGQTITYTLTLLGSGQALTLTDSLPLGVSAPGPIVATFGNVFYNTAQNQVEWRGIPAVGQAVTLTFPVTVTKLGPSALFNTAVLTATGGSVSADTTVTIIDAYQVYLPLTMRSGQ